MQNDLITSERWPRIKAIFHSAQQYAPAERALFLSEACGDDETIRRQVESLLAADASNEDFLSLPAYEFVAGMLAEREPEFVAGQQIDRYTILAKLGSGGMGEVYLAQDERLGRRIALKLISADFARDETRVRRFEQEASAALLINHPNVCVIHEIGITDNGRHFIAMEHVEGMTLRDRMTLKQLRPAEALQVAIQVAAALEAAHAAGIVHRDIKPENIMRRPDGFIKVLDFGLAKLSEELSRPQDFHEASTARVRTEPWMRMGTVRYMSPEQLREAPVDERTDLWSLGVVLYEMVTGNTPFATLAHNETIASILGKQALELTFADDLSPMFQQVIRKALKKDRAHRYQTVTELAADLKLVRHELRRRIEIEPSPHVRTLPVEPVDTKPQPTPVNPTLFFRLKSQAISTAEFLVGELKQHKKAAIVTGATVMFAGLFLMTIPLCRWGLAPCSGNQLDPLWQARPLTNSGKSVCAAISPDRKFVAHAEEKDGKQSLLLTTITTPGASQVMVPPSEVVYSGITFSRDGNYVYFTQRKVKDELSVLYQVPILGGVSREIKEGVDSPISFSPNGDRFSFVRFNRGTGEYALMIAETEGSVERIIATRAEGNIFSVNGPAWSPDAKTVICGTGWWDRGYHMNLVEFDLVTGQEKPLGAKKWFSIYQVAWLANKSALVFSARERWTSPYQLWRISYPDGQTSSITSDPSEYESASLSDDGNTIVSVRSQQVAQVWVAPDGDAQRAKAIVSTIGYRYGLAWTGTGKLVYSSMVGSNVNISVINADGSNSVQLTANDGDNYTPAISADDRYIVFASNRGGSLNIWRMNAEDGSEPKQLTFSDGNSYPSCSPDGKWVVYDNQSQARTTIWKVSIEGGDPIKLSDEYTRMPVVSPDGQFIACRYYDNPNGWGIAVLPFQGGATQQILPITVMNWQRVQWTANSQALTYVDTSPGTPNLWSYNLATHERKQLTFFMTDQIFGYSWSPDFKQLASQNGSELGDVFVLTKSK